MRLLPLLLPLVLLPLGGCLDGGGEPAAGPAPEPEQGNRTVRRVLLTEEGGFIPLGRTPAACSMDDYRFSIHRRADTFVRGHAAVELHVTLHGTTTGLQFGHGLDHGPATWQEPVMEGEHRWVVDVSPEEWEPLRHRWNFWWRFAPGGVEDCNTGVLTQEFTFEAHALPP